MKHLKSFNEQIHYDDIFNKHGQRIYKEKNSIGNSNLEKYIKWLIENEIEYSVFELKDKEKNEITCVVAFSEHEFEEESEYKSFVFSAIHRISSNGRFFLFIFFNTTGSED